jgi:hypothetical protein
MRSEILFERTNVDLSHIDYEKSSKGGFKLKYERSHAFVTGGVRFDRNPPRPLDHRETLRILDKSD